MRKIEDYMQFKTRIYKISFFLLLSVLSSCGMQKLTPSGISSVRINSNINPTEINDNNKITVKNLKGETRSYKTPNFTYNSFDDYNFTKNQFSYKRRTLIISHPNYKADTIVIRKSLRPVVFSLDALGAITLFLSPSLIVDLANGNVWKVKKGDKNLNINLYPKLDFFQKKIDSLNNIAMKGNLNSIESILNELYSMKINLKEEPYVSKLDKIFKDVYPQYLDLVVEKMDYKKLSYLEKKYPEPYASLTQIASEKCREKIEKFISSETDEITSKIASGTLELLNSKQLKVINQVLECKKDFVGYQIDKRFMRDNTKIFDAYIKGASSEIQNFKDSTRRDFKSAVNLYKRNISALSNELNLDQKKINESISKIDSISDVFTGYRAFCLTNSLLLGNLDQLKRSDLPREAYNNGILTKEFLNDPSSYVYKTKFSRDSTKIVYSFPNHVFKNEKYICTVKYDFPDETGSYTERDKSGKTQLYKVNRNNIYYKYYSVKVINNQSYDQNQEIASQNAEKTKQILKNSGNNTVNTYLKINQSSEVTGPLYIRKLSFTPIEGNKSKATSQSDFENLVYKDKNYIFTVRAINKLDSWDSMVNRLSSPIEDMLDYGEGYRYNSSLLESLFLKNKCTPDLGGEYGD
jgi:hypothetical protein